MQIKTGLNPKHKHNYKQQGRHGVAQYLEGKSKC